MAGGAHPTFSDAAIHLASVSADGAYDTKACHAAIAAWGAMAVAACKRLGLTICQQWSGYHRRSLVETKMHCFKRLGERVMARSFAPQVVELHVRVALLNRFTQLGTLATATATVAVA